MRRRAVYRVYAGEEHPFGEEGKPFEVHEDERPGELPGDERPGELPEEELRAGRPLVQPAWHSPQRPRTLAIALLAAGFAFVAALAIHAFSGPGAVVGGQGAGGTRWGGSQATSVVASQRVETRPRSGEALPRRAHRRHVGRRMGRGAVRAQERQEQTSRMPANAPSVEERAVELRAEERAVAYSSPTQAAPAVAGSAESEFSFER